MVKNLSLFGNKGKDFFTIQQIIYYSFLSLVRKKRIKESTPTALPQLKCSTFFLSAARRSLRSLCINLAAPQHSSSKLGSAFGLHKFCGAALLTEKATPFLNAAPVRSGKGCAAKSRPHFWSVKKIRKVLR